MSKLIKAGTQQEIEQFLYSQSEMLDSRRWQDWINLFTQDGIYWMPADPADEDGDGIPSIFYEDHYLMRTRMKRLDHPRAWSQSPAPRTSHLISNVQLDTAASTDQELVVRSRFLLARSGWTSNAILSAAIPIIWFQMGKTGKFACSGWIF